MTEKLNQTRKDILKLIVAGKVSKIKDIEDSLKLNRSGVLRHVKESQQEGWIERTKTGKDISLKLTQKGLIVIGCYNFNDIIFYSKLLDNITCIDFLEELILMDLMEIQSCPINCVENLEKYRLIKRTNNTFEVSQLGFSVLVNVPSLKEAIEKRFDMIIDSELIKINDNISTLEKELRKTYHTEVKIKLPSRQEISKLTETLPMILKESHEAIIGRLYLQNKTLKNIIDDEETFQDCEKIIHEAILDKVSNRIAELWGRNLLKGLNIL